MTERIAMDRKRIGRTLAAAGGITLPGGSACRLSPGLGRASRSGRSGKSGTRDCCRTPRDAGSRCGGSACWRSIMAAFAKRPERNVVSRRRLTRIRQCLESTRASRSWSVLPRSQLAPGRRRRLTGLVGPARSLRSLSILCATLGLVRGAIVSGVVGRQLASRVAPVAGDTVANVTSEVEWPQAALISDR